MLRTYDDAIATLNEIVALIDTPGEGLGHDWGLQSGQWGHVEVSRARDAIRRVRDQMVRHEALAPASSEEQA